MRRVLLALAALGAASCGYVGEPLPPLANVPGRIADLSALQLGNKLIVQFTVPKTTTEGFNIKTPLQIDLRIGPGGEPFDQGYWENNARKVPPAPIENGAARYEVPTMEWTGKEVVVGVRATGSNGKVSGWSNLVSVPVVPAPQIPQDLRVDNTAEGLRLSWRAPEKDFRVLRRTGQETFRPLADISQPTYTDTTTQFGEQYTYQIQGLVKLGDNQLARSEPSAEISFTPIDKFPPTVPTSLRAIAAPASIELSWDRNNESDFASYRVYRSVGGGAFERVTETDIPTFSDRNLEAGKTYRYQVSAVDRSGNESSRTNPTEIAFQ
jgi:hypothetical protein